jgi:hypothetical protein
LPAEARKNKKAVSGKATAFTDMAFTAGTLVF